MSELPSLVLFEGLPGSGKTTTSRQVAASYRAEGLTCRWALEEDDLHPAFGRDVRRQHRRPDYDDICIRRWQYLVERACEGPWLLEGCAFQSTVRFMFEQAWSLDRIEAYWRRFEAVVAAVGAVHVHLVHPDPESFLRSHTMAVRAPVWSKIAQHVERTPAGRALAHEGVDEPSVEFWVRYHGLCCGLLAASSLPVLTLDTHDGWDQAADRVVQWLDDVGSR